MIPDTVLQQFVDGDRPLPSRELRILVRELLVRRAEVDALRAELSRLAAATLPPPTPTTPGGVPSADPETFQEP